MARLRGQGDGQTQGAGGGAGGPICLVPWSRGLKSCTEKLCIVLYPKMWRKHLVFTFDIVKVRKVSRSIKLNVEM